VLDEPSQGSASSAWREAVARAREDQDGRPAAQPEPDVWILEDEGEVPTAPAKPTRPARQPPPAPARASRPPRRHRVPEPVVNELAGTAGLRRGPKLAERLGEATHAYDRERYQDALRILRPLAEAAPDSAAVRELYGLTLYRLGRWRPAIKELDASRSLSPSYDQLPVVMDCLRALRRYRDVAARWDELRQASPSAEVVAEGRIVMAGALADQGQLRSAISMLEKSRAIRKPREHHLRQWYALADLYERAGDIPRARDTFARIAAIDPDAFDTRQRLRALR
jgi:tetratricopeptide (TPR) repeat protein